MEPPVVWEVARSSDQASEGQQAIRLRLDNLNSQAKIWIERRYKVEKNQAYAAKMSFDFGSSDFDDVNLWRLLAGAGTDSPAGAGNLSVRGDSGNGESSDQGYQWVSKTYEAAVTSDADGELVVYVGIWGTSASGRIRSWTNHIDSRDRRPRAFEANGVPLSVRIRSGSP